MMPSDTSSSASAPFSDSSLPTCGPTNSTRCCVADGSSRLQRRPSRAPRAARWTRLPSAAGGSARCRSCRSSAPNTRRGRACRSPRARWLKSTGCAYVHLDHRAAAEVDAEVQAARREEEHGEHERHERDHVEHERVPHERDVARGCGRIPCSGPVVRVRECARSAGAFEGVTSRRRSPRPAATPGRSRSSLELLAVAVDQVDEAAREEHRREHRGHDAEAVHDREAAHRAGAEDEQREAGDQRRHVRVEDRGPRALVAGVRSPPAASRPSAAPRGCAR